MANLFEVILLIYSGLFLVFAMGCFSLQKHKGDQYIMFFMGGVVCLFCLIFVSILTSRFFYLILVLSIVITVISLNRYFKMKAMQGKPLPFKKWLKKYGSGWPMGTFGSDVVATKFEEYERYKEQWKKEKEVK